MLFKPSERKKNLKEEEREMLKQKMKELARSGNADLKDMIKYFPDIFHEIQEDERIKNIEKFIIQETNKDPILKEKLDHFFETRDHFEYKELYKEYPMIMDVIFGEEKKRLEKKRKEEIRREKRRKEEEEKRRKEEEEEDKKWVALDGKNKQKESKNGKKSKKTIGKIMSRRTKRVNNKKSLKH